MDAALPGLRRFLQAALPRYTAAGYPAQTARLATTPFARLLAGKGSVERFAARAAELERAAGEAGFAYLSLGPALPAIPASYAAIPAALSATRSAFFGGMLTGRGGRITLPAARACAAVIRQAAMLEGGGFANLRFAALANVPAGAPFFPAAYHSGGEPAFALALEAAGLAVEAFAQAGSLDEAANQLTAAVERHARALESLSQALGREFGLSFGGLDFSLAPFPDEARSLGAALERLGLPALGMHGSLTAAALTAQALDRARFHRAGFSGLMFPILEDITLARRAAEGRLSLKDLLLYSAVCGSGLDTAPLPGDASEEALAAVLLDLAALAQRLNKPLTARLMPIPGKAAGDFVEIDFAFFAASRVLPLEAQPLQGLFQGEGAFHIASRGGRR
jgi:hypothetical protein